MPLDVFRDMNACLCTFSIDLVERAESLGKTDTCAPEGIILLEATTTESDLKRSPRM